MTIDFICEELAELFDSPCNYSPMDEKMFQDSYCESHCGKITDKECWKRYFEKVWADRKTEPTISKMEQVDKDINVRSKDEPQTETEIAKAIVHKMIDDAVIAEDAYPDLRQRMHNAVDEYEPQPDCSWK